MKYLTKKRMKDVILVLRRGLELINNSKEKEAVMELLMQMQDAAIQTGTFVEKDSGTEDIVACFEYFCEELYHIYKAVENRDGIREHSDKAAEELSKILALSNEHETEYKVVFLPYKMSMWDSMESIYMAMKEQNQFICQIVPVPYFNKDKNNTKTELIYEGDSFRRKYNILDYREYCFDTECPDIIFIHNPYDNCNRVTEVKEEYFSNHLKSTGAILVYVCYYIAGYTYRLENMGGLRTPGAFHADYIVVQNENLKKAFLFWGINEKKLLVTGSPKIDYVHNILKQAEKCPEEWKELLHNKTVFLLNSGIHTFLNNKNWINEIEKIIYAVIEKDGCGLIWRPHPLLRNTIISMRPETQEQFDTLLYTVQHADSAVLDYNEEYKNAFLYSDAMISDYSSLVLLYTYTGKPVYLLKGSEKGRKNIVFCDYFSNYFKEDGMCLENFIENVCNGIDPKKEERMQNAYQSIVNSDGSCGEKTVTEILKKMENELYAGSAN